MTATCPRESRHATIFSPIRVTPIGLPRLTSFDSRMTYHWLGIRVPPQGRGDPARDLVYYSFCIEYYQTLNERAI
jgi:hypothetical protein